MRVRWAHEREARFSYGNAKCARWAQGRSACAKRSVRSDRQGHRQLAGEAKRLAPGGRRIDLGQGVSTCAVGGTFGWHGGLPMANVGPNLQTAQSGWRARELAALGAGDDGVPGALNAAHRVARSELRPTMRRCRKLVPRRALKPRLHSALAAVMRGGSDQAGGHAVRARGSGPRWYLARNFVSRV